MKDFSSLETKIRKLVSGKLQAGGWEQMSETLWVHPVAEIARIIDSKGVEHYINKAGEAVNFVEDNDDKRKAVVNVGRPDTAKDPVDPKQKLTKQAEIKTKIIDERDRFVRQAVNVLDLLPIVRLVEKKKPEKKDDDDKDDKKEAKPDKKGENPVVSDKAKDKDRDPKGNDKKEGAKKADGSVDDDKDPKQITGGKTDVDIHPTTDDNLTDDSKEKEDADKTAKKENKKIGAKGSPVKEAVLDEISKRVLGSYIKGAAKDVDDSSYSLGVDHGESPNTPSGSRIDMRSRRIEHKIGNRHKGIAKAVRKISTEETLDELSDQTVNRYAKKAKASKHTTDDVHTYVKRKIGLAKVQKRKDLKTEEFSADELAHIEAVMAEEYVDMSKKKCDEIINAKGKPHKVYTATDETRHGIGVDELKRHLGVGESDHVHKKFMHNLHTAGVRTGWSHSAGKWIAYHGKKV